MVIYVTKYISKSIARKEKLNVIVIRRWKYIRLSLFWFQNIHKSSILLRCVINLNYLMNKPSKKGTRYSVQQIKGERNLHSGRNRYLRKIDIIDIIDSPNNHRSLIPPNQPPIYIREQNSNELIKRLNSLIGENSFCVTH